MCLFKQLVSWSTCCTFPRHMLIPLCRPPHNTIRFEPRQSYWSNSLLCSVLFHQFTCLVKYILPFRRTAFSWISFKHTNEWALPGNGRKNLLSLSLYWISYLSLASLFRHLAVISRLPVSHPYASQSWESFSNFRTKPADGSEEWQCL